MLDPATIKEAKVVSVVGGAATALDQPQRADKELRAMTLRTEANEVVIGVMAVTLARKE